MRTIAILAAAAGVAFACDATFVESRIREADSALNSGRFLEARRNLEPVVGLVETCNFPADLRLSAFQVFAFAHQLTGRNKEAVRFASQAIALAAANNIGDAARAAILSAAAQVYAGASRYYDAEPLIQEALEIWQRQGSAARPIDLAVGYNILAILYLGLADPEGASRQLKRAREYAQQSGSDLVMAGVLHSLANAAWQERKLEECRQHLEEAIRLAESQLGSRHALLTGMFQSYARVLQALHRKPEARIYRDRAKALSARHSR